MSDQATDLQGAAATQRGGRRPATATAPALPRRMKVEEGGFEPTVVGAVRRYWLMVGIIALLTTVSAVGYTLVVPEVYRADATVTVPQTSLSEEEASDQYLDSQVLLLQSQEVADRAARIANAALNENVLSPRDFSGEEKFLEIKAPEGASPGSYGASIVAVSFIWPSARVAQIGTNAVLQAFDDVRAAAITAQGEAIVAGIEKAIDDARTEGQRKDLLKQRTQTLVNQQIDLARHPTVAWAAEPQVPINGNSTRSGAIGLVIGMLLGASLAYARASSRRCLEDRLEPATIYEAPLIGEIPAQGADRIISPTDAYRATRRRATFFGLVLVFAIGLVVVYFAVPGGKWVDFGPLRANSRNLLLGVCCGLALLLFGIGAVHRTRTKSTAAADPLPMAGNPQSRVAEAFRFTAGSIQRIRAVRGNRLVVALVSTNTGAQRSFVSANVALAAAESGTPVLAVDADFSDGGLTDLLLPGRAPADGFAQVIAGQRPLSDCIQPSPLNRSLAVLGSGPAPMERTTGAAYSKAVNKMIDEAKTSFDLVLIDSPALLRMADATELVDNSDAAIVVLGSDEPVRDHITMVERLDLVNSEVVGYIYRWARRGPGFARDRRDQTSARIARRTRMPSVPSSTLLASRSASSRSPEVHHSDEATSRRSQGRLTGVKRKDRNAADNGRQHQPNQPSPGRDGTWQWPPWASTAANERENSRSLVSRPRG
jgi:Mrp family chromosome partitioning ATPase